MDFLSKMKDAHLSGRVPTSRPLQFPYTPEFEPHPAPEDNIAHVEQSRPLTASDCNGLSIEDVKALHDLRSSDPLHKADKVSSMHKRGKALAENLAENGTSGFTQNY